MYTRDFGQEEAERTIPDTYCGNLFPRGIKLYITTMRCAKKRARAAV